MTIVKAVNRGRRIVLAAGVVASAGLMFPPYAGADPDPHIPDGAAGWCLGGQRADSGGQTHCLGEPFPDGTFYVQTQAHTAGNPFGPAVWGSGIHCEQWIKGTNSTMGASGGCGGG